MNTNIIIISKPQKALLWISHQCYMGKHWVWFGHVVLDSARSKLFLSPLAPYHPHHLGCLDLHSLYGVQPLAHRNHCMHHHSIKYTETSVKRGVKQRVRDYQLMTPNNTGQTTPISYMKSLCILNPISTITKYTALTFAKSNLSSR